MARPEIPDGHRVTGAFTDGDRVVVATEAGRMRKTQSASESFLATARPYLWQVPLALAPESELLPAQASATRTGRDVRVCVPEGHERPPLIGWTLGDAGAGAAAPAAAVDSGERCIVLVRTAEPPAGREEDAFIAHGPVPGLGLVTLAAGPTAAPTMALGSDDAPPQNDGFPPGWLSDLGGTGAWRLEPTLETDPLTCPTGPCQRLSWRTRAEAPTSRLIGGLTEAPVFLTGGGALLIAGDTVTVHPPGQLAPSVTRTVPAPPTGDLPSDAVAVPSEVWLPGASLDTTWRCTVTARDQGIEELESIACRRGDGVLAATDRCGRGLATGGSERVQPDGLLRMVTANPAWDDNPLSVGTRPDQAEVLWDPTTGQCAVRPIAFIGAAHMDPVTFVITTDPVPAGEADAVQAPDGARFVVEASPPPIFSDPPEPTTWRIYQIQPRHAGRELLAEGSGPDRGYTIVPGRDGVTLWSAGVTNIGTPIPAVLLRHIPRMAPAPCACGLGAICERGACACPDGTTGDPTRAPADGGCLATPGRAAAPAPSCAALPEAPAAGAVVWIDPDGLGGPFVPLPATCDAGLTRPISLVALGRGNEVDLHGAFAIDDFALELGLLVL
ncbi:MAG: hypothetical protein JNJ59_01935, partial [Deltaproteobacteria bacterium]|nr:hypothetical protein [Deltaproteobacteria bacterium]